MRAIAIALGFATGLLLSGCSPDPVDSGDPALRAHYKALREQAVEDHASPAQLQVLDAAIADGRLVTFEEYRQAKELEIECIEGLGFSIAERQEINHGSWTEINYMYGGFKDEATGDALLDEVETCRLVNGAYIDLAYQESETEAERAAKFESFRTAILDCLAKRGVTLEPDASQQVVLVRDGEEANAAGMARCAEEVGYVD